MKFSSVVITCDKPNKNGHVYSRKVVDEMVERFRLSSESLVGQLGMPEDGGAVKPQDAALVVRELGTMPVDGGCALMARIETTGIDAGRTLAALLEAHPEAYAFRTCGIGDAVEQPDGTKLIVDFELTSVNVVRAEDAA